MKQAIKLSLTKHPCIFEFSQYLFHKYKHFKLNRMSAKDIFSRIHESNLWGDLNSTSGSGSNLKETEIIREKLPELLIKYHVLSILDIPCGDFYWMNNVNLQGVNYIGADIVSNIIENNKQYEGDNIKFHQMDLINDLLPTVDLVFIRDCLVHLSYESIFKSLDNICKSGSQYLLTTTFTEKDNNNDILIGQWRALNMQIHPFNLPKPIFLINEGHYSKEWSDKSLGLWKIEDIKKLCKY